MAELNSLTLEELKAEDRRLAEKQNYYVVGITYKCPECNAKPNEKCKTNGGNTYKYIHSKRHKQDKVKEELDEVSKERQRVLNAINDKINEQKAAELKAKINIQANALTKFFKPGKLQTVIVEYRNTGLVVVEADNIIIPQEHTLIYQETLEKLLDLGVVIKMRQPQLKVKHNDPWRA